MDQRTGSGTADGQLSRHASDIRLGPSYSKKAPAAVNQGIFIGELMNNSTHGVESGARSPPEGPALRVFIAL